MVWQKSKGKVLSVQLMGDMLMKGYSLEILEKYFLPLSVIVFCFGEDGIAYSFSETSCTSLQDCTN